MTNKASNIFRSILSLALLAGAAIGLAYFFHPIYTATGTSDYFLACLLVGIPFGIRHMVLFLSPAGRSIGESIGILAADLLIGGMIGFFALCILLAKKRLAVVLAIAQ